LGEVLLGIPLEVVVAASTVVCLLKLIDKGVDEVFR
jgi:hypothetical protein